MSHKRDCGCENVSAIVCANVDSLHVWLHLLYAPNVNMQVVAVDLLMAQLMGSWRLIDIKAERMILSHGSFVNFMS